jgi:hypothetical protein
VRPVAPIGRLGARLFVLAIPPVFWLGASIVARAFTPRVASSGTRLLTDLRSRRIAMRLLARWCVLSFPALFPQRGVLLLLRVDELLARIAVLAAGTPIAAAFVLINPIPLFLTLLLAKRLTATAIVTSNSGSLLRVPQLAARKPFHFRVRVFFPDALKRRQQFFPL